MSAYSLNTVSPTYTMLKPKTLRSLPTSINCFALNYVTHKLLLCNKEKVILYDLASDHIASKFMYAKELGKIYESEIEIKSADAIILSNMWVTLVNKKSFLFFNDKLEFSRVYTVSNNALINLQVLQRTNDMITIREDQRAVKIWKLEVNENGPAETNGFELSNALESFKERDHKKGSNIHFKKDQSGLNNEKEEKQEKQRKLKELGQTFEVNVFVRRQLHIPQNRFLTKFSCSEELKIAAIAFDNAEVYLYNLITGDHINSLDFSGTQSENIVTSYVSINQELLYYCDEKKIVVYDLVLNEEVINQQHMLSSKVISFHAERTTNNSGIYILTGDEKVHVYSLVSKKVLWSEDLRQQVTVGTNLLMASDSSSRDPKPTSNFMTEAKNALDATEVARRDYFVRNMLLKSKYKFATDLSNNGLTTLFICKPGSFYIFDVMNSGKVLFHGPTTIKTMKSFIEANDITTSSNNTEEELVARVEFGDFTTNDFVLKTFENKKNSQNLVAFWKNSRYENTGEEGVEDLKTAQALEVITLFEERLFVVLTQGFVHVVSLRANRMLSQNMIVSDVTAAIAVPLNYETSGSYYVILGTKKGLLIILECDFGLRDISVLKSMPRHDSVLKLKYLRESNNLLSIGTEGDIFVYTFTKPSEANLFPTEKVHQLIWNQINSVAFLSEKEIVAGLDNGVIQYAKFNWQSDSKLDSKIFEYHEKAIKDVCVPLETEGIFVAYCQDSIITCWYVNEQAPIKVFRLGDPIISVIINVSDVQEQIDLYVALENVVLKLEYDQGGIVNVITKDDEMDWNEAVFSRSKYAAKIVREGKTINAGTPQKFELLSAQKKTKKDVPLGEPSLNKFFYNNQYYGCLKSLEADFLQYLSYANPQKPVNPWIFDSVLSGFYQKKLTGESLSSKPDGKSEKKALEVKSLAFLLNTTLKKYPIIRSMIEEKEKAKELEEMHKNTVFLLNIKYDGEDDLEAQYKFLEENYSIPRESLDEAYFVRAKILYYKKSGAFQKTDRKRSTQGFQSKTPREPPKNDSKSSSIKLPSLETDRKLRQSPDTTPLKERETEKAPKQEKVKVPKLKHFKNYSESLDKEMMKPTVFPSQTIRELTKNNEFLQTPFGGKGYRGYLAAKGSQTMRSTQNFSFSPSPRDTMTFTTFATPRRTDADEVVKPKPLKKNDDDKIGIGQLENTIKTPFFITSRADMNRDIFLTEAKTSKNNSQNVSRRSPFSLSLSSAFPRRNAKDFVELHSKGFKAKENTDMFNQCLRLLLKNHHVLKSLRKKHREHTTGSKHVETVVNSDDEDDIEYVPIEIKQYVLEVSQKEMEVLNNVIYMYETRTGTRLPTDPNKKDESYSAARLEDEMEKENAFLEQIISLVNERGIESISLNQMIQFKQIMKRRVDIFSQLQSHIEASNLLQAKPESRQQLQAKGELIKTFHKVKEIADLKSAYFPQAQLVDVSTPKSLASGNAGVKEAETLLGSIKKSIQNVQNIKALDLTGKGFESFSREESPARPTDSSKEYESEEKTGQMLSEKKLGKSLTGLTPSGGYPIRSWNDVVLGGTGPVPSSSFGKEDTKVSLEMIRAEEKKKLTLTAVTEGVRGVHRMMKAAEILDKQKVGSPKEGGTLGKLGEEDRYRRIETLLARQRGLVSPKRAGMEDGGKEKDWGDIEKGEDILMVKKVHREEEKKLDIEKALKEKDFSFIRSFLIEKGGDKDSGPVEKDEEKEDAEGAGNAGKEEKGAGEAKNYLKKKKKKRNPNINTSSGSVVTAAAKVKPKENLMNRRTKEDLMDDLDEEGMRINEREEAEEDDGETQPRMRFLRKNSQPLKTKKMEVLNWPSKESIKKTLKITLRQNTGSSVDTRKIEEEEEFDYRPMEKRGINGFYSDRQESEPGAKEDWRLKNKKPKRDGVGNEEEYDVADEQNPLKIHPKNSSLGNKVRTPTRREEYEIGDSDEPGLKKREKSRPRGKTKHEMDSYEYEGNLVDEKETKPGSSGSKMRRRSNSQPKQREEEGVYGVDGVPGVRKESVFKKIALRNMEKSEFSRTESKATEGNEGEGIRRRNISFADSVKDSGSKAVGGDVPGLKVEEVGNSRKFSYVDRSKKVDLVVKGEENSLGLPKLQLKGRMSQFAKGDGVPKNDKRMSQYAANRGNDKGKQKQKGSDDEDGDDSELLTTDRNEKGAKIDKLPDKVEKRNSVYRRPSNFPKFQDGNEHKGTSETEGKNPEEQAGTRERMKAEVMDTSASVNEKNERKTKIKKVTKRRGGVADSKITTEDNSSKELPIIKDEVPNGSLVKIDEGASPAIGLNELREANTLEEPELYSPTESISVLSAKLRNARNTAKTRSFEVLPTEDLLNDPLKLFQAVFNVNEVDQETKLDLFFYGNRKEALKDFVNEIENTIEYNIMKTGECRDQLAEFFDSKMNGLLQSKMPSNHYHLSYAFNRNYTNVVGPNGEMEDGFPAGFMEHRFSGEYSAEHRRKMAFQHQQLLKNTMKATTISVCSSISQAHMGAKMRKGKIILSPTALETLVQGKDELLLNPNHSYEREGSMGNRLTKEEQEELELLERLERLRRVLRDMRDTDPEEFEQVLARFTENRKLYDKVMREVDRKNKAKSIFH